MELSGSLDLHHVTRNGYPHVTLAGGVDRCVDPMRSGTDTFRQVPGVILKWH